MEEIKITPCKDHINTAETGNWKIHFLKGTRLTQLYAK